MTQNHDDEIRGACLESFSSTAGAGTIASGRDDFVDRHAKLAVDRFELSPDLFKFLGRAFSDGVKRNAIDLLLERFLRLPFPVALGHPNSTAKRRVEVRFNRGF